MIKNTIAFVICVCCLCLTTQQLYAQNLPLQEQYLLSRFVINPAVAGYRDKCSELELLHRQQWLGMPNAPTVSVVSFHTGAGNGLGAGARIFNDQNGLSNRLGLDLALAYHIRMGKDKDKRRLSFGAVVEGYQQSIDESRFNGSDPIITGTTQNWYNFDVSAGMLWQSQDFTMGVSAINMISSGTTGIINTDTLPSSGRNIFTQVEYRMRLNRVFLFEPAFMYRTSDNFQQQIDINPKLLITTNNADQHYFWIQTSYKFDIASKKGISVMPLIGFTTNAFQFSLAYDIDITPIQRYTYGSVSLGLAYMFCPKSKKAQIHCPAYKSEP